MTTFLSAAILLLTVGVSPQQPKVSIADFDASDPAAKVKVLREITSPRTNIAIDDFVGLVRIGLHDSSADVRNAALAAVMVRAMSAMWAGSTGPTAGPSVLPRSPQPTIPAEWAGDAQALLQALEVECLVILKGDADDRVRHQAMLTVGNLELTTQPNHSFGPRLVPLFVELYRHDHSARIRAEVVKTFRLTANYLPEMRAVLRDALVDPNSSIRHEALTGISPQATAEARRLSFAEARDTIVAALAHGDPGVRLGAVQALNVFGAPAAPYIHPLERLRDRDPDAQVRASAQLAIESIERALRGPGPR